MILFFGIRFKDATLANQVERLPDRAGLHFGHYGMAYCLKAFESDANRPLSATGLSFELAVRADALTGDRFQILMMLHGGRDVEQLLIGQWHASLIVMHGNDYDGSRGEKRVGVEDALPARVERLVTITSDSRGTRIFIDGQPVANTTSLALKVPNRNLSTALVVGNSVNAHHSWNGDLFGLAIYEHALASETVANHFRQWKKTRDFSMSVAEQPTFLYLFNETQGQKAFNRSDDTRHLVIPARMQILKKEILSPPWDGARWNSDLAIDIVINFLGFIPLGFFLGALWADCGRAADRRSLFLTVGFCFVLSLGIELAQAWIPSRSSQMLDLMLNTLGGATGFALRCTPAACFPNPLSRAWLIR